MDKLQTWLARISQPPRAEVANIDYWDLLLETRILQDAGAGGIGLRFSGQEGEARPEAAGK